MGVVPLQVHNQANKRKHTGPANQGSEAEVGPENRICINRARKSKNHTRNNTAVMVSFNVTFLPADVIRARTRTHTATQPYTRTHNHTHSQQHNKHCHRHRAENNADANSNPNFLSPQCMRLTRQRNFKYDSSKRFP